MIKNKSILLFIVTVTIFQTITPSDSINNDSHQTLDSVIQHSTSSHKRKHDQENALDMQLPQDELYTYKQIVIPNIVTATFKTKIDFNEYIASRILLNLDGNTKVQILEKIQTNMQKNGDKIVTLDSIIHAQANINFGRPYARKRYKHNLYSTAIHEAGHAVTAAMLHVNKNLHHKIVFISIIPYEKANGFINYICTDTKPSTCTDNLHNIVVCLAGDIAQQIHDGQIPKLNFNTSGNQEESEHCIAAFKNLMNQNYSEFEFCDTKVAIKMAIDLINKTGHTNYNFEKPTNDFFHSDKQAHDRIFKILFEAYKKSYLILNDYKNELEATADALMKKVKISGDEFYDITGIDSPLCDFEEGPLPKKSSGNYARRWITNHEEMNQYAQAHDKEDSLHLDIKTLLA